LSNLSDEELNQLLADAAKADKRLRPISHDYESLAPRITRLLEEQRDLRAQAAERDFHYHEEGAS
jgi:hypothetical protein